MMASAFSSDAQRTSPKPLLVGVDWARAFAAFSVAAAHAPLIATTTGIITEDAAITLIDHMRFRVPFFFAAAFVFISTARNPWTDALPQRAERLLIPFGFWSAVYLTLHTGKNWFLNGDPRVKDQDLGTFFLGSAAVHLYFLPMLFTGTAVAIFLRAALARLNAKMLFVSCLLSLGLSHVLRLSGNDFNIDGSLAFESWLGPTQPMISRMALVVVAWTIMILPYLFFGAWFRRFVLDWFSRKPRPGLATLLCGLNAFQICFFMSGELSATTLFLSGILFFSAAIAVSPFLPENRHIKRLGAWSFGIYLMHVIPLQLAQIALSRYVLKPGDILGWPQLLGLSVLAFAASAFGCWLIERWGGRFFRAIIGLRD